MGRFSNSAIIQKLPIDHFGNITKEVINLLLNGQCCAVYGIHGYGMDFFAKHICFVLDKLHHEVKQIYLNLELATDKIGTIKRELCKLTNTDQFDEITISKYLSKNKLVLVLGKVITSEHRELFRFISELQEIAYDNFTVLSVGDFSLYKRANDYLRYGKTIFAPLRRIPNFDFEGVTRIIEINNKEYHWNIPKSLFKRIYQLSGGSPALVKYICMAIYEEGLAILNKPERLIKFQPLNYRLEEISTLFTDLTVEEQVKIGLLTPKGTIFSKLVEHYLRYNTVQELDTLFPNLTPTEKQLLTLFIRNPNKIINKDQISLILKQTLDSYSEWAIYKIVARLRKKVSLTHRIETLKGRGWRLDTQ